MKQVAAENSRDLRGFLWMIAGNIALPATAFATGPLLARGLGVEDRGQLAALVAVTTLAPALSSLGQEEAAVFYYHRATTRLRTAVVSAGAFAALLGLAGGVLTALYIGLAEDQGRTVTLVCGSFVASMVFLMPMRAALVHEGQFRWLTVEKWSQALSRLALLLLLFLTDNLTVTSALLVHLLCTGAGAVLLLIPLIRRGHRSGMFGEYRPPKIDPQAMRILVRFGGPIWFGVSCSAVILRLDQIVMSQLSNDYQLGLYAVAVPLAEAALMASAAAQLVLLPRFLRSGRPEVLLRSLPLFAVASALICILVWPLSSWIVTVMFGVEYAGASWPFNILLLGTFCAVWLDLLQSALGASGRPMLWAGSTAIGCVVMTAVLMTVIRPLGAVGAAIATSTGYAAAAAIGTYLLWRQGNRDEHSLIGRRKKAVVSKSVVNDVKEHGRRTIWAIGALAVVAVLAVTISFAATGGGGTAAATDDSGGGGTRAVVLGDSYAEGTGAARIGGGFVQTFASSMGWKVDVDAQGGTGYYAAGPQIVGGVPSNRTSLVERSTRRLTPDKVDYVVVAEGLNDRTAVEDEHSIPASEIGQRADLVFGNLLTTYPGARLIVVGPFWPNDVPTPGILDVRDEIEHAATLHNALFIDPIGEKWITSDNKAEMISNDGTHPTQAGHDYIAFRLMEDVRRDGIS